MNDTKVQRVNTVAGYEPDRSGSTGGIKIQRYEYDFIGGGHFRHHDGEYVTHTDHARIVAELDEKQRRTEDNRAYWHAEYEKATEAVERLTDLLAKYQRLHAADVAWDEARSVGYVSPGLMPYYEERRLAMEALATHPQDPTKS